MRQLQRILGMLLCGGLLAMTIGGCGAASSPPNTITMGAAVFSGNTSVTIKVGQAVHFNNPSGSIHELVVGMNALPIPQAGAPAVLNVAAGDTFNPGKNQTITFAVAGTYAITCIVHPPMQATVKVTP